jgi:crotonobetainyl-CoA:carnitine CoA-transferase CaiB-like acyl-CoA transferase
MGGPLEGVRVFDLTLAMVGPYATAQLGALGADVLHIEAPEDTGVRRTTVPPSINGTSIGYINWNMNKRSIFLDLKNEQDRATAFRLLETCDIFVENMRPGVVDRLGVDYETVSRINPRIIYVSSSGWGDKGPMVNVPATDGIVQVFGGWSSVTGPEGGPPEVYRHTTQNDSNTSNYIVQAVLLALLARDRTGRGQRITLSMLSAVIALQSSRLAEFFATGQTPPPMGSANTTVVPDQAFRCQDKAWVAVTVDADSQWAAFCHVLHLDELIDDPRFNSNPRRVANRAELIPLLQSAFASKPRYHWIMELNEAGVPAGKFMEWDEIRFHPQVTENEHVIQVPTRPWGTVYWGGPPYHFSRSSTRVFSAPLPGEHTEEVLSELTEPGASPAPHPDAATSAHAEPVEG